MSAAKPAPRTPGPWHKELMNKAVKISTESYGNVRQMTVLEHGAGTTITISTNGTRRPRYYASRFYADGGKPMKMSARWARRFVADCLRGLGGAS